MCVVSAVGDYANTHFPAKYPWALPSQFDFTTFPNTGAQPPSRAEFDLLKLEIESLKKLLTAAKEYDAVTGQHDCEHGEKVALIKRLAEIVGVDLSNIF